MEQIQGYRLKLRLVTAEDAAYIQELRTLPQYGRYLSEPAPSTEAQRLWIETYKAREAEGLEYYFVIQRLDDDSRCGVVRLYDIMDGKFTWGSWILDDNKPDKAALDSALLVYQVAFDMLGCKTAVFDVRIDNQRTIAFHRRFGAIETGSDAANLYFRIDSDDFEKYANQLQLNLKTPS